MSANNPNGWTRESSVSDAVWRWLTSEIRLEPWTEKDNRDPLGVDGEIGYDYDAEEARGRL